MSELIADVKAARKRVEKLQAIDLKQELTLNLYPLLEKFASAIRGLDEDVADVVSQMDDQGSLIEPDLSEQIVTALDFAGKLIDEFLKIDIADEVLRKRLHSRAEEFSKLAIVAIENVVDSTLEEDDEDDDEDDDQDEKDTVPDPAPTAEEK